MNRNLIVLRCGKHSLHKRWKQTTQRKWDLEFCPYQETDYLPHDCKVIAGQKWAGLYQYLTTNQNWRQYDYVWFPDDDLMIEGHVADRFFQLCDTNKVQLAAPALSPDSYFTYPTTMANSSFTWRKTTFVEIMMPCFRREFLERAYLTFALSPTGLGFGLDFLWPAMLNYDGVYIFDETQIAHTRPAGSLRDQTLAVAAKNENDSVLADFRLPWMFKTVAASEKDGTFHSNSDGVFLLKYLQGYEYLCQNDPAMARRLLEHELSPHSVAVDPQSHERIEYALKHVIFGGSALSRGCPALVSSVSQWSSHQDPVIDARGGNDGRISGHARFHTEKETNPWWQVDLGSVQEIHFVDIYNRLDQKERCVDLVLLISDDGTSWSEAGRKEDGKLFGGADGNPYIFWLTPPMPARFVRVQMLGHNYLHLDQVEVFGNSPARAVFARGR